MCQQQRPANPCERARQRGNDNERIKPRLKIDDDQQISKHDCAEQTQSETLEGVLHGLDLSPNVDVAAFWQIFFDGMDVLFHFIGHAAEVAAVHRGIQIDRRLSRIVRYFPRPPSRSCLHEIAQNLGSSAGRTSADGRVLQRLVRVHPILRLLHRHAVLHTVLRIEPKGRTSLKTGTKRNEHVLRDVAGLYADGLRARPVDLHEECRAVKCLLNVNIHCPGNVPELVS